jgi:hypothetical protein
MARCDDLAGFAAVVRSPEYFSRHPRPITPQDLTQHELHRIAFGVPRRSSEAGVHAPTKKRLRTRHGSTDLQLERIDRRRGAVRARVGMGAPRRCPGPHHDGSAGVGTRRVGDNLCRLPRLLRQSTCLASVDVGRGGAAASRKPVNSVRRVGAVKGRTTRTAETCQDSRLERLWWRR